MISPSPLMHSLLLIILWIVTLLLALGFGYWVSASGYIPSSLNQNLQVRPSTLGGRGVFATRRFGKGEIVEVCPTLARPNEDWGEATADYVFGGSENTSNTVLVWGLGSLYNHSDNASVHHELSKGDTIMTYKANRDIEIGEEITVDYGSEWWVHRDMTKH